MIGAVLGWCLLLIAAGGLALAVMRRAAGHGILAPVLVGLGLRVVVMVVAHLGSLSLGDHGLFFVDDGTYRHGASVVAELWRGAHLTDPARYDVLGTYQYGYQLFLAAIFTLGTTSVLLGKLANVLLGGVTVYLVGRLGGELLGERAKVRAAWTAALAPSMVWWSATLMKETLATMLLVLGLLAVTRLPRPRAVGSLLAVFVALTLVRGPAALALLVGTGVGIAAAGRKAEGRLISRPLIGFVATIVVSFAALVLVVSAGNPVGFLHQYDAVARTMFDLYGGGDLTHAPYNAVKSLVTPLPWVFDSGTHNWDRMLYPGVWLMICALPLAAVGVWRLRIRPEIWACVATVATALAVNSATGGFTFRQRSILEPVILLLALAGASSWRMAARVAAGALGVTAGVAAVQSRSPVVAAVIVGAAVALALVSRRLSDRPFDPPPESPLVARFRASIEAAPPIPASLSGRVSEAVKAMVGTVASWLSSGYAALLRLAPKLDRAGSPRYSPATTPSAPTTTAYAALLRAAPQAGVVPPARSFRPHLATRGRVPTIAPLVRSRAVARRPSVPQAPAEQLASPAGGYRPALDGVRAVAVLAVIAYHLGTRMSGGFLGVDVFFVLSGYLITTLLLSERWRTGRISFAGFWARRARRLLPALFIVVAAVALMTAHLGVVSSFAARRADMIATIFYYANWHFIEVGQSYFAQFGGTSPLEHMWSLAIEEQFYLVWPVVIGIGVLLTWRRTVRPLIALMVVGAIASTALMIASYDVTDPTRSYFGTDTRAHALLLGALLATVLVTRPTLLHNGRVQALAAWVTPLVALLVFVAFFAMPDQTGFYYHGGSLLFALVVAVGLLFVEAKPRSALGRLLSVPPVRWIGMISYGLYLWHWPMIVWVRNSTHVTNPRMQQVVAVLLTFVAATLSFYLVERPVRSGRVPWLGTSRRRLAGVLAAAAAVVIAISIHATSLGSNPIARQVNDVGARDCPAGSPAPAPRFVWCSRVAPSRKSSPVVAVAGDSTALALDVGMERLATERGWGYVQAGKNGCSLLPLSFPNHPDRAADIAEARRCISGGSALLADVAAKAHPALWLVADRWSILPLRYHGHLLQPGDPLRRRLLLAAWRRRLKELTATGAKVVVVLTPPQGPPVECATKSPAPAQCASGAYTTGDPETVEGQKIVRRAASGFGRDVAVVSVDDIVCPDHGRCPAAIGGLLVRYDGIHYTAGFSRRVLNAVFARAAARGIDLRTR